MKRLLLPLALTLLLVPSAVAWPLYSPVVVAEGKVHFYLIDDATGTVLCARSGLVAVEVDVEGRVAWHAPGCDEAYTPAARTFPDCRVTEAEASCGGAGHFTLARWGKFVYRGAPVDGVRVEMDGVLTVPTTLPPT